MANAFDLLQVNAVIKTLLKSCVVCTLLLKSHSSHPPRSHVAQTRLLSTFLNIGLFYFNKLDFIIITKKMYYYYKFNSTAKHRQDYYFLITK